jgi:hypothetical protein
MNWIKKIINNLLFGEPEQEKWIVILREPKGNGWYRIIERNSLTGERREFKIREKRNA